MTRKAHHHHACLQAASVHASQTLEELAGSVSPAASFQGRDEETFRCAGHCVGIMLSAYCLCCSDVGASISIAVHGGRCRQLQAHCLHTRPKISRDAHARPARTVQKMSRGDALRHELLLVCMSSKICLKSVHAWPLIPASSAIQHGSRRVDWLKYVCTPLCAGACAS